jgi:hypothetical protein
MLALHAQGFKEGLERAAEIAKSYTGGTITMLIAEIRKEIP